MFDELKTAVTHLRAIASDIDVDVIDGKSAAELLRISEDARRVIDGLRTSAIGRVGTTEAWRVGGSKNSAEWVALHTGTPIYEAQAVVILAGQLRHLPQTVEAMSSGKISTAQAVEVARGATAEPHAEERLLNLAKSSTVRTLRDEASRVIAAATDEVERHKRIHKNRYIKTWTDQDGAFNLKACMTVANGALVMAALKPLQEEIFKAARKSGEHATPEAYAADALVALCAAKAAGAQGLSAAKPACTNAVMNIRIDIDALKRGHTEHGEVCEIAGVGPIPVATATEYLGEAFLKLLVIDGTDITTIAHMGRAIPAKMRTAVEERDRLCQVPTCDVTLGLEIDHIIPFAEGGPASLENLVRLCKRHHLQKTHDGYRLEAIEDISLNASKGTPWRWRPPPDTS
jgi:HNH endonuclease